MCGVDVTDKILSLDESAYLRRERRLVGLFLLFAITTTAFFVYTSWHGIIHALPVQTGNVQSQIAYAPDVYRVAMPALQHGLHHLHLAPETGLMLSDFVFGYLALYLTYILVTDRLSVAPQHRSYRFAAIGFFLAAIQFPLGWVLPWLRPETMPTAFFIAAASVVMLQLKRSPVWIVVLACLTLLQGLTRADAPCFYGIAIVALGISGAWLKDFGSRGRCIAAGVTVAGTAVLVQAYMQFIRYPHAPYPPGVPRFMLPFNLAPHFLAPFLVVLTPVVVVVAAGFAARVRFRSIDSLAIVAAALYVPIWFTVGSLAEVRIFVPFLLLLTVPASRILATLLTGQTNDDLLEVATSG
jgi:hypothetical protein